METKLRERIQFPGDVTQVWEYLAKPELWPGWVEKISKVTSIDDGYYRIEIGGKIVIGTIESLDAFERMRFVGMLENRPNDKSFAIEYTITSKSHDVIITETQEISIPFPFNWLAWFLHNYGRRQGVSNLENLRELCQQS